MEVAFQNAYHQIRDGRNGRAAEIIQYLLLEFTWEMGRTRMHHSLPIEDCISSRRTSRQSGCAAEACWYFQD